MSSEAQEAGIRTVDFTDADGDAITIDASGYTTGITVLGSTDDTNGDVYTITGSGADTITTSDAGADQLTGGDGSDTFNINSAASTDILDLKQGDVFVIDKDAGDTVITVKSDYTATSAVVNNEGGTTTLKSLFPLGLQKAST